MRPPMLKNLVLCALVLVMVPGCSLTNPYVGGDDSVFVGTDAAGNSKATLSNAVRYAEDTRNAYEDGMGEHGALTRVVGTVLIAAAAAAAAIGLTGGGSEAIGAIGAGGAGLFGIGQMLHSENRVKLYGEAHEAVGCVLGAFAGLRGLDLQRIEVLALRMQRQKDSVAQDLAEVVGHRGLAVIPEAVEAKKVLDRANAALSKNAQIRSAGPRLYDAVEKIRASVNKALIANEPDLAEIVAGLRQAIPAHAQMIVGPFEGLVPAEAAKADVPDALQPLVRRLAASTGTLAATVAEFEALVSGAELEVADSALEGCFFDPNELGLVFRTQPANDVVIATHQGDATAEILVAGGKPPYHARWLGQSPGDQATIDPVDHDSGTAGHGIVRIKAKGGATGTHRLLVFDEGQGSRALTVSLGTFRIESQRQREDRQERDGGDPPPGDANLKAAQAILIELECLPARRGDGEPNDDGFWGDRSKEAFAKLAGTTPDQVETALSAIEGATLGERVLNATTGLKAAGRSCKEPAAEDPPVAVEGDGSANPEPPEADGG